MTCCQYLLSLFAITYSKRDFGLKLLVFLIDEMVDLSRARGSFVQSPTLGKGGHTHFAFNRWPGKGNLDSWQLFEPRQDRFANIPCYLTDLEKHQGVGGMSRKAENPPPLQGRGVLNCLLYTSPSPRDYAASRMPSSA